MHDAERFNSGSANALAADRPYHHHIPSQVPPPKDLTANHFAVDQPPLILSEHRFAVHTCIKVCLLVYAKGQIKMGKHSPGEGKTLNGNSLLSRVGRSAHPSP